MKILSFNEWISEKMKIIPISNDEFNQVEDIQKNEPAQNTVDDTDYKDKTLCSLDSWDDNRSILKKASKYNINLENFPKDLYDAADATDKRMSSWTNLSNSELIEKNRQRSNKKMTVAKVIASMYCAFRRYRLNPVGDKIIRFYMNRLNREFKLSDADIIKIFFE